MLEFCVSGSLGDSGFVDATPDSKSRDEVFILFCDSKVFQGVNTAEKIIIIMVAFDLYLLDFG